MDLKQLHDIAIDIINHHCKLLKLDREKKRKFKYIDNNNKLYGQPFGYDLAKKRSSDQIKELKELEELEELEDTTKKYNTTDNRKIIELKSEQKTGDDNKYYTAIKYIFNLSCNNCQHTACPYCILNINIHDKNLKFQSIFEMSEQKWNKFANENNFAPTKKVIKLISNDIVQYIYKYNQKQFVLQILNSNTPESNTPESNTPESNTSESNTPESNTSESNTSESNTSESNTPKSNTSESNTSESNTSESNKQHIIDKLKEEIKKLKAKLDKK